MGVAVAELPRTGQGSERWLDSIVNFDNERRRVVEIISDLGEAVGIPVAIEWLKRQTKGALSEWGAGEKSLEVQPGVSFLLKRDRDGNLVVLGDGVEAFGEQLGDYLHFNSEHPAVRESLERQFGSAFGLEVGEGVVRYSPQDFYEDYDSPGDVLNPMVVTGRWIDGDGEEVVRVSSWFLFLNRKLSGEERAAVINAHGGVVSEVGGGELGLDGMEGLDQAVMVVGALRRFSVVGEMGLGGDEVVRGYVSELDGAFREEFRRGLFVREDEEALMELISRTVRENVHGLLGLLRFGDRLDYYKTLWGMMRRGQGEYASLNGMDEELWLARIDRGDVSIMGFHRTTGEDLGQFWDSAKGEWIGGDKCGGGGEIKCAVPGCGKVPGENDTRCSNCGWAPGEDVAKYSRKAKEASKRGERERSHNEKRSGARTNERKRKKKRARKREGGILEMLGLGGKKKQEIGQVAAA